MGQTEATRNLLSTHDVFIVCVRALHTNVGALSIGVSTESSLA